MPTKSQRGRGGGREANAPAIRSSTRTSSRSRNTVPAPTLHANGAAEIAFQANIASGNNNRILPPVDASQVRHGNTDTLQPGPIFLSAVEQEMTMRAQVDANQTGPPSQTAHADDNPFLLPAPPVANVRFDLPSTPPSVGAETFASPSPTQSELDEGPGHLPTPTQRIRGATPNRRTRANMTPNRQTPRANVTPNRRTQANATPSGRTPGAYAITAHTLGAPRAGKHSPLRARHREQRRVLEAKKLNFL